MEIDKKNSLLFQNKQKSGNFRENSWYDISSPFQITYEYCKGTSPEDFCNILTLSPTGTHYRTIPFSKFSNFNTRPTHTHNFFELLIVLKGNTIQKIEEKEFMYSPGVCCLINRNLSHTEKFTGETQLLFICLSVEFVMELLSSYKTAYFREERKPKENSIVKFMEMNLTEMKGKSYMDFFPNPKRQEKVNKILQEISDTLIKSAFFPQFGTTYMIKGLISSLLQYLDDGFIYHHTLVKLDSGADLLLFSRITHLLEDTNGRLSRSELEKILNYNGSYINAIVKRHTGMCLFDYSMTFCLKQAAQLLIETEESVSSIALKLHFSNRTHFYKLFKEKYGLTPKEYRINYKIR